ncbi:hypothetical protein [uncultured Phycicoccus sp.]|uniref:hypothetical protein n=1 Tax=uncultured Phycicoccus sp. TaxID=661422 RepID=UPI002621AC14|nr:hypothetical protein [uncultured Phycicoccus sp.]
MTIRGADAHLVEPGHLPTPFTAEEIRRGCPDGRTIVLRVEPAGQPPQTRTVTFVGGDARGTTQVRAPLGADGRPGPETGRDRSTWRSLQAHASFPRERSTVQRARLDHPLGDLDCFRYTVSDGDAVDTYWFDRTRPGMPVLLESRRGSEVVLRVTVVSDEVHPG